MDGHNDYPAKYLDLNTHACFLSSYSINDNLVLHTIKVMEFSVVKLIECTKIVKDVMIDWTNEFSIKKNDQFFHRSVHRSSTC